MKLVDSKKLYIETKTAIKIYDIQLLEISECEYLVNYKHGIENEKIKEDTATIFPVKYDTAKGIFEQNIANKEAEGYSECISRNQDYKKKNKELSEDKILTYLNQYYNSCYTGNWKLSRIIRKAGEYSINIAKDQLVFFLNSEDSQVKLSTIYTIGRNADGSLGDIILNEYKTTSSQIVKYNCLATMLAIDIKNEGTRFRSLINDCLPKKLYSILSIGQYSLLTTEGLQKIANGEDCDFIYILYILSKYDKSLQTLVNSFLQKAPFIPGVFRYLRLIYKLCEQICDFQNLAILAYRFANEKSKYENSYFMAFNGNEHVQIEKEMRKGKPSIAYIRKTPIYFRKRFVRYLKFLSDNFPKDYICLASYYMLEFNDESDLKKASSYFSYVYNKEIDNWEYKKIHLDGHSTQLALNYILYSGSKQRCLPYANSKHWHCTVATTDHVESLRVENHPEYWDDARNWIFKLLSETKSSAVNEFAYKVFKANPGFEKYLEINDLVAIIGSKFEISSNLGLEIARKYYLQSKPRMILFEALAKSSLKEARLLAIELYGIHQKDLNLSSEFLYILAMSEYTEIEKWLYDNKIEIKIDLQIKLAKMVCEQIKELKTEINLDYINKIVKSLYRLAPQFVLNLDLSNIEVLMHHNKPNSTIFAFGLISLSGNIDNLFKPYLDMGVNSDCFEIRLQAISIFNKMSDNMILSNRSIINSMLGSKIKEVRQAIMHTASRLVSISDDSAKIILKTCVSNLLSNNRFEKYQEDIYGFIRENLRNYLYYLDKELIIENLLSKYKYPQQLGMICFKNICNKSILEIDTVVRLFNSDIKEIREYCWTYFMSNIDEIKENKNLAISTLNSKWDDSLKFAIEYFENYFQKEDWNFDLFIDICDNNSARIQQFGQKLILKYFDENDTEDYLIKLSQHPSQNMQLFVSDFLNKHAANNVELILKMNYFIDSVLMKVNTGRIIKDRLISLLEKESFKDKRIAELFVRKLENLIVSTNKTDKLKAINIITKLKIKYNNLNPDIDIINIYQ
ncbi:MAG: hypothetical protein N4A49_16995 [Marinifilaceae bacterium]|nr:hypothetical protein [Marinifilaceae bacterium]